MKAEDKEHGEKQDVVIHSYDGIEEYDNRLPLWWQYTLYGAIVFAAIYWFHYQVLGAGASPKGEFDQEMAAVRAADAERAKRAGAMTPEALVVLSKDGATVAQGKEVFVSTCAACHRADGGGNIGPNLTDEYWLHGGAPDKIFRSALDGVPTKGMPAWGNQIGTERVASAVAYLLTIKNSHAPGGKQPQGDVDN
jgi:cytochrome c oxidase cbb3-type subunit III